ncbi:MAG: DUF4249 domain-containing protein [Bacteroidales bacterium]|nr:DUF4249 domain-containing protein [Bacteroidales bacterium]
MKYKSIFLSFIILSIFISCTEKIDIELDDSYTRLVVVGKITTDTTIHTVKLTTTSSYFYNQPSPRVSDAIVTISDGDTIISLNENPEIKGIYETSPDFYGIIGKTYKLNISGIDINNDGKEEQYNAECKIPPSGIIDSIDVEYIEEIEAWEVQLYTWEPPTRDFYIFKVYKNGILLTDSLYKYFITDDELFNGNYTNGIGCQYLRNDKENEKAVIGDIITFEIDFITENYYKFILELIDETIWGYDPMFSGPPANISTNLNNGALGFFAAYSIERSTTIID